MRRLLVAVLGAGVLAPAAQAAYPGGIGAVAFVGSREGAAQVLYARDAEGVRPLFETTAVLGGPVFSPRGRRIALTSDGALMIIGSEGQGLRQVSAPGARVAQPSWSPDGGSLVVAEGATPRRALVVVGADGASVRVLHGRRRDPRDPAWSATGVVAFSQRSDTRSDLFVKDALGGPARRLTRTRGTDLAPAWSPDGATIAFARGRGGIWAVGADGTGLRKVSDVPGGPESSPAWAPDGSAIVFASGRRGERIIWSVDPDGSGRQAVSTPRSDGRDPDWQPAGFAPLVFAGGDVACDPNSPNFNGGAGFPSECAMRRTSDLALRLDLDAVLVLGDLQYNDARPPKFQASFAPTWGRLGPLLRPVPGNHEYRFFRRGRGYFDYFNGRGAATGPAGQRGQGWYSFDVGAWHVVALNSICGRVDGGCAAGSPQEAWLRADLAANPARCTLAFTHVPRFGSGGSNTEVEALYQVLYDGGVDVLVSADHHLYERLAPLDPAGNVDPVRGIRNFVVGTGGKSLVGTANRRPGSEVLDATTFGGLTLELLDDGYRWLFAGVGPGSFSDAGEGACH